MNKNNDNEKSKGNFATRNGGARGKDFELLPAPGAGRDKFDELRFAQKFMTKAPPMRARASDWFSFDGKAWRPIQRDRFRKMAMETLPSKHRLSRHAKAILDHVEWTQQLGPGDELRSAVLKQEDGSVLVNVNNGILEVWPDQVTLRPHNPDYFFTGSLAADWSEHTGRPELFLRVAREAMSAGLDMALFQWFSGYLLYPDCKQNELFLICYGPGGTGKSTLADAVVSAISDKTLVTRLSLAQICTTGPGSYALPTLQNALVNLGAELDTVEMDESANFKMLVSGEPVTARSIYGQPFEMTTTCKLWFLSNSLPRFKSGTDAELRRARFLSFGKVPKVKDRTLKDRILMEKDGILAWMVEGLQAILQGLPCPIGGPESEKVLRRFELSNDPLGFFIRTRCRFDPGAEVPKDPFINAFNEFMDENRFPQKSKEHFCRQLYERYPQIEGIRHRRKEPEYYIRGIVLI